MEYKYLILFPIPEPYAGTIKNVMDTVAIHTDRPAPHHNLCPHITFHPPIVGIDESVIKNLTQSMVLQLRQTRVTVSHFHPFGKEYIVLPVHATLRMAAFWSGLTYLLSSLPEYTHGAFDHDNTLHITIAEKLSDVFDTVWPTLKGMSIDEMHIPTRTMRLMRKPMGGEIWETVAEYDIPG